MEILGEARPKKPLNANGGQGLGVPGLVQLEKKDESKKWGGWGAQVEEEEAELAKQKEQEEKEQDTKRSFVPSARLKEEEPLASEELFPTLGAAAAKKETKPQKKKKQTMSLSDFQRSTPSAYGSRPTIFEPISLPSGPRERTQDELDMEQGGIGGAFKDYGGQRDRGRFDRDDRDEREPSRADVGDWNAKAPPPPDDRYDRRGGGGGFSDRDRGFGDRYGERDGDRYGRRDDRYPDDRDMGPSRADEEDRWSKRRTEPEPERDSRRGGFSDRYEDRDGPRGREDPDAGRADGDWGRGRGFQPSEARDDRRDDRRGDRYERDDRDWSRRSEPPAAGPERPRLNLKPRSLPVPEFKAEPEAPRRSLEVTREKPSKPRSNPFGSAKPVEVDYVSQELKYRNVQRDETEEEKDLKSRIEALEQEEASLKEGDDSDALTKVSDELQDLKKQLEKLALDLDDKVRFSKAQDRDEKDRKPREPRERKTFDRFEKSDKDWEKRPLRDDKRSREDRRGRGEEESRATDHPSSDASERKLPGEQEDEREPAEPVVLEEEECP